MTISIITPWLNGAAALLPDYTKATEGAERILVDNGSAEEDAKAIEGAATVCIRNEENKGFAYANNQGYAKATGDIIIFLNSDVAPSGDWLQSVLADVKDGALYGPSLQHQLVYGHWWPYIEGWCIAATRETWDSLGTLGDVVDSRGPNEPGIALSVLRGGPWDARRYPGPYWEDNDLCLRAMEARFSLIHTAWPIQHKGGQSAGPLVRWGDIFEKNRTTFAARCRQHWEAHKRMEEQQ